MISGRLESHGLEQHMDARLKHFDKGGMKVKALLTDIGQTAVREIKRDMRAGRQPDGTKMVKYSSGYSRIKTKAGKNAGHPNLMWSGMMAGGITAVHNKPGEITIAAGMGGVDKTNAYLSAVHQKGLGNNPVRKHIGYSKRTKLAVRRKLKKWSAEGWATGR